MVLLIIRLAYLICENHILVILLLSLFPKSWLYFSGENGQYYVAIFNFPEIFSGTHFRLVRPLILGELYFFLFRSAAYWISLWHPMWQSRVLATFTTGSSILWVVKNKDLKKLLNYLLKEVLWQKLQIACEIFDFLDWAKLNKVGVTSLQTFPEIILKILGHILNLIDPWAILARKKNNSVTAGN